MKWFKIFGFIFTFCIIMLMITWLIRLGSNKTAFVGISDIYKYFEQVDIMRSWNDMLSSIEKLKNLFTSNMAQFGNISSIEDFFKCIGDFIPNLFNLLKMPIDFIFYIAWFIFDIISSIVGFFSFILSI